jgi:uncharacterized protein (TIGR03435 family)
MSMRMILVLGVLSVLSGGASFAQTPTFEVASIKPSAPDTQRGGGFGMSPSGLFQVQGLSLAELIQAAYSDGRPFYRFQLTGGPDWLDSARFDITASSSVRNATPAQTMAIVKAILIERFKVVVRQQTTDAPIYILTLANKDGSLGPRMRKSSLTCPGPGCDFKINPGTLGTLSARGLTVDRLAFSMAGFSGLGRIIVDRTGLTGGYDMEMEWTPMTPVRQTGNLDPQSNAPPSDGANIFTALREQLGLKLESSRGPVPMLVIERVEKPSQN